MKANKAPAVIDVSVVKRGRIELCILGTTPVIPRRISIKAAQELIFPHGKKTSVEKATSLKHFPLEEFRTSAYIDPRPDAPTAVQINAACFKMAAASVPLDLPDTGTSKAQLGRLLFTEGDRVSVYGIPYMKMDPVRNSDMNHTPDIRTRLAVKDWACRVQCTYVLPVLREAVVTALFAAAGFMRGVGDWRPEKGGSGNFGCFELVEPTDPRFLHILATGGREVQLAAIANPMFYDDETEALYTWFMAELERRKHDGAEKAEKAAKKAAKRGNGAAEESNEVSA